MHHLAYIIRADFFNFFFLNYLSKMRVREGSITNILSECAGLIQELGLHELQEQELLNTSPLQTNNPDYTSNHNSNNHPIDDEEELKLLSFIDQTFLHDVAMECMKITTTNNQISLSPNWQQTHGIHSQTLNSLTTLLQSLSSLKQHRKQHLASLGTSIANLWELLNISSSEQLAFTQSVTKSNWRLSYKTICAGKEELKRLQGLKQVKMDLLIGNAKDRIYALAMECCVSKEVLEQEHTYLLEDRSNGIEDKDDLLQMHTDLEQELEALLESRRPLLALVHKYRVLVKERKELEDLRNCQKPDRLLALSKQRGAALTKQLMLEEKMQRRVKKDLPKIIALLRRKLDEYKGTHGNDFIVYFENNEENDFQNKQNIPFLQVMDEWEENHQRSKEDELRERLRRKHQAVRERERERESHDTLGSNGSGNRAPSRSGSRAPSRSKSRNGNTYRTHHNNGKANGGALYNSTNRQKHYDVKNRADDLIQKQRQRGGLSR